MKLPNFFVSSKKSNGKGQSRRKRRYVSNLEIGKRPDHNKEKLQEREKAAEENEKREKDIALGNPLLMPNKDTETKRRFVSCKVYSRKSRLTVLRWDDDVVFRNQARGTENKGTKEFVNVSQYLSLPHENSG